MGPRPLPPSQEILHILQSSSKICGDRRHSEIGYIITLNGYQSLDLGVDEPSKPKGADENMD
jgi:hypothetical protein